MAGSFIVDVYQKPENKSSLTEDTIIERARDYIYGIYDVKPVEGAAINEKMLFFKNCPFFTKLEDDSFELEPVKAKEYMSRGLENLKKKISKLTFEEWMVCGCGYCVYDIQKLLGYGENILIICNEEVFSIQDFIRMFVDESDRKFFIGEIFNYYS